MELVGQGPQALGEEAKLRQAHRELAGARLEEHAFGADDVAEVEVLERLVGLLAEGVPGREELDPAGRVLERREAGLAHDALEHQPAGQRHGDAQRLERLVGQVAVPARQLGGAVARLEVVREGGAAGANRGELGAAFGDEGVVFGGWAGQGAFVVHPRLLPSSSWFRRPGSGLRPLSRVHIRAFSRMG